MINFVFFLMVLFYGCILFSVITDLYNKSVYTLISLSSFFLGIFIVFLRNGFDAFFYSVLTGFFGYILFYLLNKVGSFVFKKEVMGMGDAEFMLGLSTQIDLIDIVMILIYSSYISSFFGILYAYLNKKKIRSIELPFIPFLFIAFLIRFFYIFY